MHSWNDAENRRRGCRNKWTGVSLEDNIIMPYDRTAWHKISYATGQMTSKLTTPTKVKQVSQVRRVMDTIAMKQLFPENQQ